MFSPDSRLLTPGSLLTAHCQLPTAHRHRSRFGSSVESFQLWQVIFLNPKRRRRPDKSELCRRTPNYSPQAWKMNRLLTPGSLLTAPLTATDHCPSDSCLLSLLKTAERSVRAGKSSGFSFVLENLKRLLQY